MELPDRLRNRLVRIPRDSRRQARIDGKVPNEPVFINHKRRETNEPSLP